MRKNYIYEFILFKALSIIALSYTVPLLIELLIMTYKHVQSPI